MSFILLLILLLLVISLFLSKVRNGKGGKIAKIFRICTALLSVSFFTNHFFRESTESGDAHSVSLQLINKLPQTLDFYLIKVNRSASVAPLETRHIGKIRQDYFRIEYLNMKNSDEYWLAGYLGRKNIVYFSQHSVPNKNIDQMIEVQNYINQSEKLSAIAKTEIDVYNHDTMFSAIWLTLALLLTFLNVVLLLKRKKTKKV